MKKDWGIIQKILNEDEAALRRIYGYDYNTLEKIMADFDMKEANDLYERYIDNNRLKPGDYYLNKKTGFMHMITFCDKDSVTMIDKDGKAATENMKSFLKNYESGHMSVNFEETMLRGLKIQRKEAS